MNLQRFFSLPNALKPTILAFVLLIMIICFSTQKTSAASGDWFFWLSIVVQLFFMAGVCILFLLEVESLAICGRDQWPVAEMIYSGIFGFINIINMFIVANWNNKSTSTGFIVAALFIFLLVILYGIGGIMMFRIWKGFVQSGASQNPTASVRPGDIQNMHPGI